MTPLDPSQPLGDLRLGDIVSVPDGRSLSVRVLVPLPSAPLGMSSFAVLGELEMLLASPATPGQPVQTYAPVDYLPPSMNGAKLLCEGAAAYWAPHLPALAGAMGEVQYRLLSLRAQLAPLVLLYRGPEMIVFVRTGEVQAEKVRALRMPRDNSRPDPVARVTAVVDPLAVPTASPQYQPLIKPVHTAS